VRARLCVRCHSASFDWRLAGQECDWLHSPPLPLLLSTNPLSCILLLSPRSTRRRCLNKRRSADDAAAAADSRPLLTPIKSNPHTLRRLSIYRSLLSLPQSHSLYSSGWHAAFFQASMQCTNSPLFFSAILPTILFPTTRHSSCRFPLLLFPSFCHLPVNSSLFVPHICRSSVDREIQRRNQMKFNTAEIW